MRRIFLALALSGLALSANADGAPDPAIQGVIRSQTEAFLRDDLDTAFTFASPAIKRLFGTPDRFGEMVREGYPMVWRPSDIRFGELRAIAERLWQRVIVIDGAGRVHALDYEMIQTGDGWQINGVQLLPAPDVGA